MQNWMGYELTRAEQSLAATYEQLLGILREHGAELPPFARRNATKALACLWQIVNGLDLDPEQLYDIGA